MNIDVQPKHLAQVLEILKTYLPPESKAYIFGSRAKNCAKQYSDLDIAVDLDSKKLDLSIYTKLKSAFENSLIPYTIDVVDLNGITKEFQNNIKNDLIRL